MKTLLTALLPCLLLIGCGGSSTTDATATNTNPVTTPGSGGDWYKPGVSTTWQLQLQGTVNTGYDVDIYDIDLFDTPAQTIADLHAAGHHVLCYFSGGSYEDWRPDAAQFATSDLGNALDGWPGERWLDIRSNTLRDIMTARLDLAADKGCDGVDADNMDGFANNSGFPLTADDQLAYNRFIANAAHDRRLAIALKNDLDQIGDLVDDFDLSVNEECFDYDECDLLAPFVQRGKPVLQVEYKQTYANDATARADLCIQSLSQQFSTLILPLALDDGFRFSCR
jgi:hypothetical protein